MTQRVALLLVLSMAAVLFEQRDASPCEPHARIFQSDGAGGVENGVSSPSLLAAEDTEDDLDDALPHGIAMDSRRLRHRQSASACGLASPLSTEPLHRPPIG